MREFFLSASQNHILNACIGKRVYARGDLRKGKRRHATEGQEAVQTKKAPEGIAFGILLSIFYDYAI